MIFRKHNTSGSTRIHNLSRWLSGFLLCLVVLPSAAHEIRPAVVDVHLQADGTYQVALQVNMEALLAGVSPAHSDTNESPNAESYNRLLALPARKLEERIRAFWPQYRDGVHLDFDGVRSATQLTSLDIPESNDLARARLTTVRLTGSIPPGAKTLRWTYAPQYGGSVLRLHRADGVIAAWVREGEASATYPLAGDVAAATRTAVFSQYLVLGFTHILPKGLDHMLFVLGLFLLSTRLAPLLWQVTAFTLAHSITLALSMYGVIALSPAIVEPLIAASIVAVAVENLLTARLHAWRIFVVFGFGLLHGLGFAGVLTEIGLPRDEFVTGLIAFNVGVEGGQLAVIALAFLVVGYWFRHRPWYRARVVLPLSALIALTGAYWMVERLWG
ncbi:MAG TPA: HupE/UreJ family protein [Acidiferrobacterales bacterium]|nr:HupE/UreJ family protein [Acidiferrobacterales bacterium]